MRCFFLFFSFFYLASLPFFCTIFLSLLSPLHSLFFPSFLHVWPEQTCSESKYLHLVGFRQPCTRQQRRIGQDRTGQGSTASVKISCCRHVKKRVAMHTVSSEAAVRQCQLPEIACISAWVRVWSSIVSPSPSRGSFLTQRTDERTAT